MALVHIVLATYNGQQFIEEQLNSIKEQSFSDFTVEICDDGSTDDTLSIVKEFCEKDKRFSLHPNKENCGLVKNFLNGIIRSESDYIMLCDQDDIWNKNKIEITLDKMRETEIEKQQPVLVFTDAMNYDSDTKKDIGSFHESSHLDTSKLDSASILMENKVIGCTTMINAATKKYLNDFPKEIRVHDWWLAMICSHFGSIAYLDEKTMKYRQHSNNVIGGANYSSYLKSRLSKIAEQKNALNETYMQAEAFLKIFKNDLSDKQLKVLEQFVLIPKVNFVKKRKIMIKYGFTKSGLIRNIGLFMLI